MLLKVQLPDVVGFMLPDFTAIRIHGRLGREGSAHFRAADIGEGGEQVPGAAACRPHPILQ